MKPLPQIATRLSQFLLWTLYRILRAQIVVRPGHRASQVASAIAAAGNPLGV